MNRHATAHRNNKISQLVILPGYACNFKCAHCGTAGDRRLHLSDKEIRLLHRTVNDFGFRSVSFAGGEPTLYIDEINRVLSGFAELKKINVSITTNGHFATTVAKAAGLLAAIKKLDKVRLSYDRFHKQFLPYAHVRNLYEACRGSGVDFGAILTIQSPLDLVLSKELRMAGDFPIGVQKVLPIGKAKSNSVGYAHMEFDAAVLREMCPNRRKISYLCGRGFSVCDVSISFKEFKKHPERYLRPSAGELLESDFYQRMSTMRFAELLKRCGDPEVQFTPAHSSHCVLCEHIFNSGGAV